MVVNSTVRRRFGLAWLAMVWALVGTGCRGERREDPRSVGTSRPSAIARDSGCVSRGRLGPGDVLETLQHGGLARTYFVHVPSSYSGKQPVPLVVDIHGWGSNAREQADGSGWRSKAEAEGFIVVHPQGVEDSWNGGTLCCGAAQRAGLDDLGFMRALVGAVERDACIDRARVYATGLSNGGAMAHLLACRAADVFAATAPVVMGNGSVPCEPVRPISVFMFRGLRDTTVPYEGGPFPSARADLDQWRALNGCAGAPVTTHGVCQGYSGCAGGTEVMLCSLDTGHVLYDEAARQDLAIADLAWDAFRRHRL